MGESTGISWTHRTWNPWQGCAQFQILTKRHGRIATRLPSDWGAGYPNVWLGVSAEDREWWDRRVDVPKRCASRSGQRTTERH